MHLEMSFISVSGLPWNGVGLVAALRRNYTNKNKKAAQKSAENGEFISPSLSLPPSPYFFFPAQHTWQIQRKATDLFHEPQRTQK